MRAFQHFPVVKTLPPCRWDITGTTLPVHMPFADISRIVAARFKNLAHTLLVRRQGHIVHKHARGRRETPGQQGRPRRGANRRRTNGIGKINRLGGQPIYMRRNGIRVAIITRRFGTPLIC